MHRSNAVARPRAVALITVLAVAAMLASLALPAAASHGPVHPQVSIADVSANEGNNAGKTTFSFQVCVRSNNTDRAHLGFTVDYITSASAPSPTTASPSSDYDHTQGTVEFAPGDQCKNANVPVNADRTDEWDETFRVVLFDATNATIGDGIGLGTIRNDDDPAVRAVNASTPEGDPDDDNVARFEIQLRNAASATTPVPSNQEITVNYSTSSGTATEGTDFENTEGSVTFTLNPDGYTDTEKFVEVPINGDLADEEDETFSFTVSVTGQPVSTGGQRLTATGNIINDDPKIYVNDPVAVLEGNGATTTTVTFLVTATSLPRDATPPEPFTVQYSTEDRTAEATDNPPLPPEGDYESESGVLTFPDSDDTPRVNEVVVTINGDDADEIDETFALVVTDPQPEGNGFIADGVGIATILDDDVQAPELPRLSVVNTSVVEGDSGDDATALVTIQANKNVVNDVTFNWETGGGSANSGQPSDYEDQAESATIPDGQDSVVLEVPIVEDEADEADEFFFIFISNASNNAQIGDPTGRVEITNDDDPAASISNATATEGDGADNVQMTFTISLDQAPKAGDASVDWATQGGFTAEAEDYTARNGTVTFQDNEASTEKTITVPIRADDVDEYRERFNVVLSNPVNATIADGTGRGVIIDDDQAPGITIDDVEVMEGNSGNKEMQFTLTLSEPSERVARIHFATEGVTAFAGPDFMYHSGDRPFAVGQTIQFVRVRVKGDRVSEDTETMRLVLSSPRAVRIEDGTGVGTILDND